MPLEEVIAGVTFQGFTTAPPATPGLQVLGIFGSSKDGRNTNRVAGGPTFTNIGAGAVVGTSWITVNSGTTTAAGLDTGLVETVAFQPGGWTMFMVARYTPPTGAASMMGIGTGGVLQLALQPVNSVVANHPSVFMNNAGSGSTVDNTIDLGTSVSLANWRMYALSFPGTAASPYTIRDLTGGTTKVTTSTFTRTGTTNNHFAYCWQSGGGGNTLVNQCDIAAGGVTAGALSLTDLNNLRTWLQGVLAVRGVTGF